MEYINPQLIGLQPIDECLFKHIKSTSDLAAVLYGYMIGLEENVMHSTKLQLKPLELNPNFSFGSNLVTATLDSNVIWNNTDTIMVLCTAAPDCDIGINDTKMYDVSTPGDMFFILAALCFKKKHAELIKGFNRMDIPSDLNMSNGQKHDDSTIRTNNEPVTISVKIDVRRFESEAAAFEWMEREADDPCIDNYRVKYHDQVDNQEYQDAVANGCCGSFDTVVMIGDRLATIGCNYGH